MWCHSEGSRACDVSLAKNDKGVKKSESDQAFWFLAGANPTRGCPSSDVRAAVLEWVCLSKISAFCEYFRVGNLFEFIQDFWDTGFLSGW